MSEPLKELAQRCQKPHWKEVGNWMVRKIERPLALFLTALAVRTSVTANQVTALSVLTALIGAAFFLFNHPAALLAGVFFFHLWYLLDHVDGQVARYRGSESLSGVYLDYLSHYVVHGAFFVSLGLGAYFSGRNDLFIFCAVSAGFGSALLSAFYDARYKAMFHALTRRREARWTGYEDPLERLGRLKAGKPPLPQRVFSLLYKSLEIHVALNTVTVIALLNLKWSGLFGVRWIVWLSLYYGALFPVVFLLRTYEHIRARKIEREFAGLFKTGS